MNPFVVGLQTVRLVGDVLDVGAKAVEELPFEQLSGNNGNNGQSHFRCLVVTIEVVSFMSLSQDRHT
jgi:hypothetical protein